jgi:hypothetical protein
VFDIKTVYSHHNGYWGEHPVHPVSDWQRQVADGETRLGYWEWVMATLEAMSHL